MTALFSPMTPYEWHVTFFFTAAGYLCGSFLSAYYLPLWLCHMDVTDGTRDKNPGTANAFMKAGIPCGILVLLCELGKGMLPVMTAAKYLPVTRPGFFLIMLAPVVGHGWSCFYGGSGGKAIAVSFGVLIGLLPEARPLALLICFYLFFSLLFKIPSHAKRTVVTFSCWLGSMFLLLHQPVLLAGCVGIATIVIYKHIKASHLEQQACTPEEKTV